MGASKLVVTAISILDLISLGLGIAAEQRRASGSYVSPSNSATQWCSYSSDIATGLAVGALLSLLVSQVLLAAVTRCVFCRSSLKPGAARGLAVSFCIVNWASFITAEACFLAGAVQNARHVRYFSSIFGKEITCNAIRRDTFVAGVVFTFLTLISSISYYLCYTRAQKGYAEIQYHKEEEGVNLASY